MIQIYHASQTDFTVNGIEVHPSECPFEAMINGTWELSMTVPYSDDHWQDIEDNGVVKVRTLTEHNYSAFIQKIKTNLKCQSMHIQSLWMQRMTLLFMITTYQL